MSTTHSQFFLKTRLPTPTGHHICYSPLPGILSGTWYGHHFLQEVFPDLPSQCEALFEWIMGLLLRALTLPRLSVLATNPVGNLGPEFQIEKFRNIASCFECRILRDINKPECIQRRESRMVRTLKITSHKQELRKLEIEPSKKRRREVWQPSNV